MRMIVGLLMMLLMSLSAYAQEADTPWQDAVTGQVEAMRAGDGAEALHFAGSAFRTQFADQPEVFIGSVVALGYGPILTSRSHSFGTFTRVNETSVVQAVIFVGEDQSLYDAVYQLTNEEGEGWRVLGVVLRKQAAIAI